MDHLSSTIIMCAILLLFYASGTVKGANIDDDCTHDDNCTDTNTVCSSDSCACSMSTFQNTTEACVNKVALEGGCANGQPPEQCADSLAECRNDTGFKCLCKPDNYKSGSVCKAKVDINASCDIADMATDQCSVPNTACSDDGTGMNKCLCTSDYYKLGSMCHDRKKPDEVCESESDQCVANAMCSGTNDTCVCNTGYKATPTSTPTSCESSDATIIIAHIYVFIFGIVASLYLLV